MTSGVARTVARLGHELETRGHAVEIRSSRTSRRLVVGEFRVSAMAAGWPALQRRLGDFDVVNIHGPAPSVSDAFLFLLGSMRRSLRPGLVYTHHFDLDFKGLGLLCSAYNDVHRRLAQLADEIVVTTPSYQALMAGSGSRSIEVVPWGVDSKLYEPSLAVRYKGDRPLRVLFVGQMRPYKGVPLLIQAVAGCPTLEVTLVGSGPLERRYRSLAASTAPENVRFLGGVTDDEVADLMLAHDVLVLPSVSRQEAFGLALLEGMAARCVPVASDLPGVRDVAGPTGRLVRPRHVGDLRRTLLDLAHDPVAVGRLQASSRRRSERMTWNTVAASYEDIFRRAMPPSGTGHIRPPAAPQRVIDLRDHVVEGDADPIVQDVSG